MAHKPTNRQTVNKSSGFHALFRRSRRVADAGSYERFSRLLAGRHKNFRRLVETAGPLKHKVPAWRSVDDAILYSVIGQMISLSASCSIIVRLLKRYGSSGKVIEWAHQTRNVPGPLCGVPQRKRKALSEWSKFKKRNPSSHLKWRGSASNNFRAEITRLWGFGDWAADMIGIFYLGRMDIWPGTDTGLIRACKEVIGTDDPKKIVKYVKGCETVAALYLWEYLDNKTK